jgi:hypothetical protein
LRNYGARLDDDGHSWLESGRFAGVATGVANDAGVADAVVGVLMDVAVHPQFGPASLDQGRYTKPR